MAYSNMTTRHVASKAIAVALVIALAGCGGSGGNSDDDATATMLLLGATAFANGYNGARPAPMVTCYHTGMMSQCY